MGLMDKISGRAKKAAGEVSDDPKMRSEGRNDERKGEAKEELGRKQEETDEKAREVADREKRS
jgi:uncharacterized protein YjbJ (UPF0337 family)